MTAFDPAADDDRGKGVVRRRERQRDARVTTQVPCLAGSGTSEDGDPVALGAGEHRHRMRRSVRENGTEMSHGSGAEQAAHVRFEHLFPHGADARTMVPQGLERIVHVAPPEGTRG